MLNELLLQPTKSESICLSRVLDQVSSKCVEVGTGRDGRLSLRRRVERQNFQTVDTATEEQSGLKSLDVYLERLWAAAAHGTLLAEGVPLSPCGVRRKARTAEAEGTPGDRSLAERHEHVLADGNAREGRYAFRQGRTRC
jgi:hypothetical protein